MKREHYVKREIIINAPRQKVFDLFKTAQKPGQVQQMGKG